MCQSVIFNGAEVTTSKGSQHFSLSLEDQANLSFAFSSVMGGMTEFPYHADGELCEMYSAEDIILIGETLTEFKLYHTTYCNHLNMWIKRCETIEEVYEISYGVSLPGDLDESFVSIIGISTIQEVVE